jgi:methionine sulfoxide reductase catalytic subunit
MLIRKRRAGEGDIPSSEITPYELYVDRRRFIAQSAALAGAAAFLPRALGAAEQQEVKEELTPFKDVTTYNNYYEFGTAKEDPAEYSGPFKPKPWSVVIEGECANPGTFALEDLLKGHDVIEPVYRMRCVEAWSMVIPWRGVRLRDVLLKAAPTGNAKFIEMTSVLRPEEMLGQRHMVLPFPYVEGLRIDEALNEMTLLATGLYGKDLLNQNGAPLRLVTPWKYGFKGIKAITRIKFTDKQPMNTWQIMADDEYGFYANVNPNVDHPRWSQARERRIGEFARRPTLMFNGYSEQVAHMYRGMDLKKWY